MPENNLGFEASHIELLIRKQCYGRIVIMYEKDQVGFLTTHATKTGMCTCMVVCFVVFAFWL